MQLLAISTDDLDTQRRFKAELKAPYPFVADPKAEIIELYDVKTAVVTYAKRTTFVIDRKRKVVRVDTGSDAIDPSGAIKAAAKLAAASRR